MFSYPMFRSLSLQPLQLVASSIAVVYLIFLLVLLFSGQDRTTSLFGMTEQGEKIQGSRGVIMENIDRIEFKDGLRKWNLLAQSLRYSEVAGTAYLLNPIVSVFDKENVQPTVIRSKSAKVVTEANAVKTAYMEGEVRMEGVNGVVVEAPSAEYLSYESKVVFPKTAKILGSGYRVEGNYLVVLTESGMLDFSSNVDSYFESKGRGTRLPNLQGLKMF